MNNLFNATDRDQIISRINRLSSNHTPGWGSMSVNQMLCHTADPFRDLLGIRKTKMVVPAIIRPIARMVLLSKKPFSKNSPTLKPYLQKAKGGGTKPTDFDSDRKSLLDLISRFTSTEPNFKFHPHPGAGQLNRDQNGLLMWKHLDHHLRQFGV